MLAAELLEVSLKADARSPTLRISYHYLEGVGEEGPTEKKLSKATLHEWGFFML
jgi:hypothetical protein